MSEGSDPWRWVVLGSAFFTMLLNAAVSYNVGVLNVAVQDSFGVGAETVSWMMAVYSAMFAITGPVASAVLTASDCRTCVFLSGLLSCAGMATSSLVTRPAWLFLTLSVVGFGQSLAQVGGSVGLVTKALVFSEESVFLSVKGKLVQVIERLSPDREFSGSKPMIDAYSLEGAFLILAAVCLNSCTCGLLMRPTPFEKRRKLEKAKAGAQSQSFTVTVKAAWREHGEILVDGNFLRFLVAVFVFALAFNTVLVFLPECLIKSKVCLPHSLPAPAPGFSHMEAATIASFVGIGSLFSRALVGFAATEQNIGEKLIYIGLNFVSCLMCMAADFLMDYTVGAYFVAFSYGLYVSPCVVLFFTLTFYVLGYEKGASGYGVVLMVYGIASLLGPPVYAIMLQMFGCALLFKFTGLLFLTSALVSTGITQHAAPADRSGLEEAAVKVANGLDEAGLGGLKVLQGDLLGSSNFELVVPSLVGAEDNGCGDGAVAELVCADRGNLCSDPVDGEPELKRLLDVPSTDRLGDG
ncbi:hypothetical protein EGW08_011759 [Elysia chlorotica]|uniref:Major facilitator superfamily (MFS) profile domain-containing protein n=1 Tax=Elysia chlorotica TaxID=188477 RepID=A0A3S0ZJP8_ELYCH|nr:hypothetical protein EGW08_011759 [Elysia chlorotica]